MNHATESDLTRRSRMLGAWLGKAVGGTLGMPFEGAVKTADDQPLGLSFYDPVPTQMVANDDLDLQVVHAVLLDQMDQPSVNCRQMAGLWDHVGMSPGEYGIAKRNLKLGLLPPATGSYDNPMQIGMGAAIRTELWACLAPGDPALAVRYAELDACIDHAGEGVEAPRFLAALQSLAFVENNLDRLFDQALDHVSANAEVRRAIEDTRRWFGDGKHWREIRQWIFQQHGPDDWSDVRANLAIITLGLLAGWNTADDGGIDFGRAICTAVNCGLDTDCTGATVGATLGIRDPDCIDPAWTDPIGRTIVLSPEITAIESPSTIDAFTDLVLDLRRRLPEQMPPAAGELPGEPQQLEYLAIRVEAAVVNSFPQTDSPPTVPETTRQIMLPGNWASWPTADLAGRTLLMRYRVNIEDSDKRPLRIFLASHQPRRAWLDGEPILDGAAGPFVAAIHYEKRHGQPEGQSVDLEPRSGEHELLVAIDGDTANDARQSNQAIEWFVSIGQPTGDHLPHAFERPRL